MLWSYGTSSLNSWESKYRKRVYCVLFDFSLTFFSSNGRYCLQPLSRYVCHHDCIRAALCTGILVYKEGVLSLSRYEATRCPFPWYFETRYSSQVMCRHLSFYRGLCCCDIRHTRGHVPSVRSQPLIWYHTRCRHKSLAISGSGGTMYQGGLYMIGKCFRRSGNWSGLLIFFLKKTYICI